ncbi:MAG: diheme cytochrome c [Aquabacterium sp.]
MSIQPASTLMALLTGALLVPAGLARADDHGRRMPSNIPPAYVQECAACHTAYPPGLLPANSWQRIMTTLDKHYGSDASLDEATVRQLSTWLQANAGTYRRVTQAPPQDRITRSDWFLHKHREIEPAVWRLPSVKTPANCAACHTRADRGDFDEDTLRFPAGLTARQRSAWSDD